MLEILELTLWMISFETFLVQSKFEMKNLVTSWDLHLAGIFGMFCSTLSASEMLLNKSFIPMCITSVSNLPSSRVGTM